MDSSKPVAKGEARERLLDTAEELFAKHGVDAVSLRQINAAAGVSPGVLHYHFGSREVLVHELVNRHMNQLMAERKILLEALQQKATLSVTDIMRALAGPLAALVLSGGERGARYVRFITRLYTDRSPVLGEISERYRETNSLYPELLRRALPNQSASERALRFSMANHSMLQVLSDMTTPEREWLDNALERVEDAQQLELLIDFMASGMSGAPQTTHEDHKQ